VKLFPKEAASFVLILPKLNIAFIRHETTVLRQLTTVYSFILIIICRQMQSTARQIVMNRIYFNYKFIFLINI